MRRVFRIPFSRSRLVRDVDDEIAFHVQSRIDALVASGMPTAEARAAALRQFGDLPTVRDEMLVMDRQHGACGKEQTSHKGRAGNGRQQTPTTALLVHGATQHVGYPLFAFSKSLTRSSFPGQQMRTRFSVVRPHEPTTSDGALGHAPSLK